MATAHAISSPQAPPHVLQPSTNSTTNKPLAPTPIFAPVTNQLGPRKEWTVPPRPKPGRKPALEAPPTKRKAQNREAQRAFRERRAAKVGELEDQMRQMEEEDAREREELRNQVNGLHEEVEKWQRISEGWRKEYEKVQGMLDRERQSKQQLALQSQITRGAIDGSTDAVTLKPRTRRHDNLAREHRGGVTQKSEGMEDMTCGRCSKDSRCQCIDEAFEMGDLATGGMDGSSIKRPLSRQISNATGKRMRPDDAPDEEQREIDFTICPPPASPKEASSSSIPAVAVSLDSCGFCQDGTTCICAEIHRQNENERRSQRLAEKTSSVTRGKVNNSCTNDPGTCAQCQAIPASKNFCTSLAASRALSSEVKDSKRVASLTMEPTIKCADAFNRLAQHPNFPQASTQLNAWVPQLATKAVPTDSISHAGSLEGRPAFEIEAASVMNVLKSFDVRFEENCIRDENDQQV